MANNQTESLDKNSKDKKALSETVRERVHRHLRDINSKITEEEIKNAMVELDLPEYRYSFAEGR